MKNFIKDVVKEVGFKFENYARDIFAYRTKLSKAFTLSEVLITLSVIGVVAVLVLPTFINRTMKKEYSVALRKKYAELTQVVRLSVIENGEMSTWDWSLDYDKFVPRYLSRYINLTGCENCWSVADLPRHFWFEQSAQAAPSPNHFSLTLEQQQTCYMGGSVDPEIAAGGNWGSDVCPTVIQWCKDGDLEGYFAMDVYLTLDADTCQTYLNGGFSSVKPADEPEIVYALPDGSQMGLYKQNNKSVLFIYLDVNGEKKPNRYGVDRYLLTMSGGTITFWGEGESDLASGDYGCSADGNGFYCGALLKKNDWKFDDNYPKF